ncbi:flagellar hook-length control protein FliK [Pollutimonas harenae]|uniref:Flagellar hook-length control protein FliK n=1 Tax=Pollutimonas harenae TaxID=657015 RepID=A0A853H2J3_9BURK|nr:flagellar hook-length control protein FliK [Pollutimonas harenae]NYT86240.1 flagellar hook-length control protein FliK [Pollutimonas harenae]TEA71270.1 hypothetical protein ERD84_11600 [Pollutimonas harenae]
MNMPAIAAVLPSVPASSGSATGTARSETDPKTTGFSNVLARQHSVEAEKAAVQAAGKKIGGKADKAGEQAAEQAADEAQAQLASEQALALPQIALHIAAEVAAVQQTASGGRKLPVDTASLTVIQDGAATNIAGKTAATKGLSPLAALLSRSIDGNTAKSLAVASTQPEAAVSIHQTNHSRQAASTSPLNARQASSIAGAKQAVLAMQTRMQAGEVNPDAAVLAEFLASKTQAAPAQDTAVLASALELSSLPSATSHAHTVAGLVSGMAATATLAGASPVGIPGGSLAVATPLSHPNWGADFSRQFVSMTQGVSNMPHTAELRLDPPELGPLRISINISDNTAHAVFVSPHAAVRQTVENALPQLQQQLAQAGISLGQTSVSDHGQPDQAAYQSSASRSHGGSGTNGGLALVGDSIPAATVVRSIASNALVDTFA